jgi:hypothetical protein
MATIKAPCPSCGAVRLGVTQVTVMVDDVSNHSYRFDCPGCATPVVHAITPAIGALLRSVGVDQEAVRVNEPDEHPISASFTSSDVADLQRILDREDWFERLLATVHAEDDRT